MISQEAYPILRKCFSPYNITYIPPVSGKTDAGNPGSDDSAITDMYLLSQCDEVKFLGFFSEDF